MKRIYLLEHIAYSKDIITEQERVVLSRGNLPLVFTSLKKGVRHYRDLVKFYCEHYGYSVKSEDNKDLMNDNRVLMVTELVSSPFEYREIFTLYKTYTEG